MEREQKVASAHWHWDLLQKSCLDNSFLDVSSIIQNLCGLDKCVSDIVYAPLHPQLWLPKRFKTQLFVPSSSPDVEFYRTHSISMFEKRIPVQEVKELKVCFFLNFLDFGENYRFWKIGLYMGQLW